ncbi:transposase family protein [Streptomyces sp. NPDC090036]|uniref:leucine-rich repeat domain-containing protein n=1 Tax=Streptomyces sp. NPDC090036 TaxID=3365926 RepID=UPI0038211AAE
MDDLKVWLQNMLFPSVADVVVLSLDVNIAIVRVDVRCTTAGASCPLCGTWSDRVHGSYLRFPADVPSGGRSVVLRLRVRRFTCPNASCGRQTFVEQISGLTRRHGQRTERLRSTLSDIGLALAGRAGARMARVLGVGVCRSTVPRLVDALPEPSRPPRGWSVSTSTRPQIARLRHLHTLDLGHNELASVPDELTELPLTKYLYLHDNQLKELPRSLGRLTALRHLNLGGNHLTSLPDTIGKMIGLVELRAGHNRLIALPESIGRLHQLRELWLRGNALTCLPESVSDLAELRHIDLRENALPDVPEALAGLSRLRHLDLRSNRLHTLPSWLPELPSLEKLDLRWNNIEPAPRLLDLLAQRGCIVWM